MSIKKIAPTNNCKNPKCEFIMDTDSDLPELPVTCASGSVAIACNSGNKYIVNATGCWVKQGANEEVIICPIYWDAKENCYYHMGNSAEDILGAIASGKSVHAYVRESYINYDPNMDAAGYYPMFEQSGLLCFGKKGDYTWFCLEHESTPKHRYIWERP